MAGYRLTVRRGSKVSREAFDRLPDAIEEMRRQAEDVVAEGGLPEVKMIRSYEPSQRVAARLEISTGGWLRGSDAGVDVMGDGRIVPYCGGIFRREIEPRPDDSPFDAVRRALRGRP